MDTRTLIVLTYKAFDGRIQGKTKLQKLIYFIAVRQDKVEECGYLPHYYGPYSPQVARENSLLNSLGFLTETVSHSQYVNDQGFEISRHDFNLTDEGGRLASKLIKEFPTEWEIIKAIAEKIKNIGDVNYQELSIAAKAYYIVAKQGKANLESIKNIALKFGWTVEKGDLEKAVKFLSEMGLITVTKK
jgi:uncharacterized protein